MAILGAVLYRHWLEIRDRASGAVAIGLLLALANLMAHVSGVRDGSNGLPLVVHLGVCTAAVLYGGLLLGGTGIRTDTLEAGHPSLYYTLALPVARFALVWIRFALALVVTAALFTAALIPALVGRVLAGDHAGAGELTRFTVLMGLLAVAVQAIGLLITMWDDRLRPLAFTVMLLVVVFCVSAGLNVAAGLQDGNDWLALMMALAGHLPIVWIASGLAVLTAILSLIASLVIAYARDF